MTLYRARIADTPDDPFAGGRLRYAADAALLVRGGAVVERGRYAEVARRHPGEPVVDLRDGLLLPGLVDAHVHHPQLRAIGTVGTPLQQWLEQRALPEEQRFADPAYAGPAATEFVRALLGSGTTTALAFGAHQPQAVDLLFAAAQEAGLRLTAGVVVADRDLPEPLLTTVGRAVADSRELADRWHGRGRLRYAVTPRFAPSSSPDLLAACGELLRDLPGAWLTTHLNEQPDEIAQARRVHRVPDYLAAYERHALVGPRSVFAHDVHPQPRELDALAAGAAVAHCPTSNSALGSGLFPMRAHVERGVRVCLGSDVGAGTGLCLFKEALQASFVQQVRGVDGLPLSPAHLLWLATAAGAAALGLADEVGVLDPGKSFDAVLVRPRERSTLAQVLPHATSDEDALAKVFALAGPADVARVWIGGDVVHTRANGWD